MYIRIYVYIYILYIYNYIIYICCHILQNKMTVRLPPVNMSSDYFSSTKAVPSSDPPTTMTRTAQEAMKAVPGTTRAVHRYTCSLRHASVRLPGVLQTNLGHTNFGYRKFK